MEFITSKGKELPTDASEMERAQWFNMWQKKNFPYNELVTGDILYWFDTHQQRLTWKTKVTAVDRDPYSNKNEIWEKYKDDMTKNYFDSRPESGYFLHYQVKVLEKISVPKPNYSFNQLGWERMDEENSHRWFGLSSITDNTTMDDIVETKLLSITDALIELNRKMQNVSPERIKRLVMTTLRKDTKIIKALKEGVNFTCQYPGCGCRIKTKNGGYYIEVAHINPVSNNGKSVLGNLIVLCPNHHKEFDYGELQIINSDEQKLSGVLNARNFEIDLSF